jgi:hypothetical protein
LLTPQEIWQQALGQLRSLVPEATYKALFADTQGGMGSEGELVIYTANPQAKAWIEAQLEPAVRDALSAIGYEGALTFDLPASSSSAAKKLPTPGPKHLQPGDVALTFLNFDLYARGWLRTPTYYELFWQPLLGHVPYGFWRLTQALYWRDPSGEHTRWVRLDIQDSAAHLGVSRDLIRGKPAKGLGGALKTLSDRGLAEVERHAAGRATVYTGRFRRRLPLLSPAQVAQLNQSQQKEHLDWLLSAGYNPSTWESLGEHHETFIPAAGDSPAPAEMSRYVNPDWDSKELSRLGFLRTPIYYDLFLQPLIGPAAYAVWRVCKCLHWSDTQETYTRDTVTSVYALAAILNCNRQKITGVKRRQNGIAYWQEGAFDRLRQERLALIREEGSGSKVAYRLLVVNEPPLLCPSQVDKIPTRLQSAHSTWLNKARLELEEWQQLSMDSLLALVE